MFVNSNSSASMLEKERTILKNVYLWMTAGLALTGFTSMWILNDSGRINSLLSGGTFWLLVIAEFALVFVLSARIMTMKPTSAVLCFAGYSVLNGITLSVVFLAYTRASLVSTFFITAGTFGAMSLYAMTTKRDLSSMATYLVMALWGIIIASLVNMFLKSSSFDFMISFVGVLVFCGLTAWDTQYIVSMSRNYSGRIDESDYTRFSIIGALKLYLDFINIFLYLLRFFGRRND